MSNPIYALTDHDHTEEELAPWLAIRDDWELADFEACELSDPHMPDPYECVVNDLRLLAEDMDKEPRHMGGLVRYDTAYALDGFKYLTFKEDDDE